MTEPKHDFAAMIECAARRLIEEHYRLLEQACEAAVQGGQYGVLVDRHRGVYRPDSRVPYGRIFDVTACGEENVQEW